MLTKCKIDEIGDNKVASWWNRKLMKCKVDETVNYQMEAKLIKFHADEMLIWRNDLKPWSNTL
jgi:hypothetical protein